MKKSIALLLSTISCLFSYAAHSNSLMDYNYKPTWIDNNGGTLNYPGELAVFDFMATPGLDIVSSEVMPGGTLASYENLDQWNLGPNQYFDITEYDHEKLESPRQVHQGHFTGDEAKYDILTIMRKKIGGCVDINNLGQCADFGAFEEIAAVENPPEQNIDTTFYPWAAKTLDLDNNGHLDAVVIGHHFFNQVINDVEVSETRSFIVPIYGDGQNMLIGEIQWIGGGDLPNDSNWFGKAYSVEAFDMDADGDLDIVVGAQAKPKCDNAHGAFLQVFRNDNGNLVSTGEAPDYQFTLDECAIPSDIDRINADGVGVDDIVVTCYSTVVVNKINNQICSSLLKVGQVNLLKNNGQANFSPLGDSIIENGFTYSSAVGDFDLDGQKDDIAVSSHSKHQVILYEGNAEGFNLNNKKIYSTGAQVPYGIQAADIDVDGLTDLAFNANDVYWIKKPGQDLSWGNLSQQGNGVGVLIASVTGPSCGDNMIDNGEECDDGNNLDNDGCSATCQLENCGDGILQDALGEECDDGNLMNGDGCNMGCIIEFCGDGVLQPGEECDDGNNLNEDGCNASCIVEFCGDGSIQPGEECDDANQDNNDGCSSNCQLESCGDGVVQENEECDDGNQNEDDSCIECKIAFCGDGFVQENLEVCDDGNDINDDDCSNDCALPTCGDGIKQEGEACDDGNDINDDACTNTCHLPICGDGIKQEGEECDDGDNLDTNNCSNACKLAFCGDGIVQENVELCDDGNDNNTDTCSNECIPATCGDGIVQDGEICDDGNDINDDDCNNNCVAATCGDGIVQAGEECDDANDIDDDSCSNLCMQAYCGDGVLWEGYEVCDDGNDVNEDSCNNSCQIVVNEPSEPVEDDPQPVSLECPAEMLSQEIWMGDVFNVCVDESLGEVVGWKDITGTNLLWEVVVTGNCMEIELSTSIDQYWKTDELDMTYLLSNGTDTIECPAKLKRKGAVVTGGGCSLNASNYLSVFSWLVFLIPAMIRLRKFKS